MKKILILLILSHFSILQYGQIIADHTVVDRYDDIPQQYIDEVKKMWLVIAGESHSYAYIKGLDLLEDVDADYTVNLMLESGTPESYTSSYLRASRATWGDLTHSSGWIYSYGEEDWITSTTAINRTKDGIKYCYDNNIPIAAIGFGWCWDDEVGLDVNDYFTATQEYVDYCNENDYPTTVYYTTGPIDYDTPMYLYDLHVRNEAIRDYIDNYDGNMVFFDYADIICHDDDGTLYYVMYGDIPVPKVTPTNAGDHTIGHIGEAGAIRLAKALWWMLARIAGWDGGISSVLVDNITITGTGGATTITTDNGTLQLTANVTPSDATNKTVTWSIINGTGQATINSTGLVTAVSNGTVTARATANDGSGVVGSLVITISGQVIPVTGITVTGTGGATTITTDNGTLQLTANVTPSDATNKTVTWSIINGTGQATINSTGLVTAVANGTVTAGLLPMTAAGLSVHLSSRSAARLSRLRVLRSQVPEEPQQ